MTLSVPHEPAAVGPFWNDMIDLWVEKWSYPGMQYCEDAKDVILTMFVPTVIMIAVRIRPSLFK